MFNDLVHLGETKRIECTFLILGSADTASDLFNFNSCHNVFSLSVKYTFHTDSSGLSNGLGVTQLLESLDGSLHQVVGIRRTLGLCQNIGNTNTLKNCTHSATSNHTSTSRCRTEQYMSTAEANLYLVRNSALEDGDAYQILLGSFNALSDGCSYFTSLTETITNDAVFITYHHDSGKCESTTTLGHLRNAVDCDESVFQLDVVCYLNSIYSHVD